MTMPRPRSATGAPKKQSRRRLPDPLTKAQAAAILAVPNVRNARGLRYRALLETLYRAGLRINEALSLAPEDVRFGERQLRVRAGKGGKQRIVPMSPPLQAHLEAWDAVRPEAEFFFAGKNGKKMLQRTVWDAIHGYVEKATAAHPELGFDRRGPISAHTFRHTFATELVEEGVSLFAVQKLMGHSDIATTQIYSHVRDTYLEEVMKGRTE